MITAEIAEEIRLNPLEHQVIAEIVKPAYSEVRKRRMDFLGDLGVLGGELC